MRKTPVLYKVHIGRLIKKHWFYQGKIKIMSGHAERVLQENNIKVYSINDLDPPKVEGPLDSIHFAKVTSVGISNGVCYSLLFDVWRKIVDPLIPEEIPLDENHPDWKREPCYIYKDYDLLLEGLDQARVLTNTEEICDLPSSIRTLEKELDIPDHIHEEAQRKIKQSCMFDAYQEKLPKRHDPNRPAYRFPRDYGITDIRKNQLLINNLTQLCDQYFNSLNKSLLCDTIFTFSMRAHGKLIQFEQTADLVVRSKKGLTLLPDEEKNFERNPMVDMYPLNCTISIQPYHFYTVQNFFPLSGSKWPYVHTIFISFNKSITCNIYEEPVLDSQIIGRNLLKGFSVASTQAQLLYGNDVKILIKPVVVQIVMTDGKRFHFSVMQLNTLDVENREGIKNVYWNLPVMNLYECCEYFKGAPTLTGYNPEVVNRIFAFYKNE